MKPYNIRLELFGKDNYETLLSWIDSEAALMQFAGPQFKFPLTAEQLDESLSDINRLVFSVVSNDSNMQVGHAEIYLSDESAKLGRILIGDPQQRGKGMDEKLVRLLLDHAFVQLNRSKADLNVFDWNTGAIKCYEKVGFAVNPDKKIERKIKDETWTAINMTISRKKYMELTNEATVK